MTAEGFSPSLGELQQAVDDLYYFRQTLTFNIIKHLPVPPSFRYENQLYKNIRHISIDFQMEINDFPIFPCNNPQKCQNSPKC